MSSLLFIPFALLGTICLAVLVKLIFADSASYREISRVTGGAWRALTGKVILPQGDERACRGIVVDARRKELVEQGAISKDSLNNVFG